MLAGPASAPRDVICDVIVHHVFQIPVHGLYQLPVVGINKQLAAQQCRSDLATDAATSCDCLGTQTSSDPHTLGSYISRES